MARQAFWDLHNTQTPNDRREFIHLFVDEMEEGHFKSFKHKHYFEEENGITTMTDHLCYETPFGIFGKLFNVLFLKRHLTSFIIHRNQVLKVLAEKHVNYLIQQGNQN